MAAAPRMRNPQSVLFACGLNSVRSPMAESLLQQMFPQALYVRSAGVRKGELDPFAVAVMAELGQDISRPQADHLRRARGLGRTQFRPHHHAGAGGPSQGAGADADTGRRRRYWPTHDPTGAEGNREQKLSAYREVCDTLLLRIRRRFSKAAPAVGPAPMPAGVSPASGAQDRRF